MAFASENLTFGQMNAIIKKLGGEEGAQRFLRGELLVSAVNPEAYTVWKTITLGNYRTVKELKADLTRSNYRIGEYANNMLGRPAFARASTPAEADLVVLSVKQLGFKGGVPYERICVRAVERGLKLCSPEVGPVLRLDYNDQLRDEWLFIAMEATIDSTGERRIFSVGHDKDGCWLDWYYGDPLHTVGPDHRFVFVLPRK